MASAVYSNHSRHDADNGYFTNLGRAVHSLIAALLAVPSAKSANLTADVTAPVVAAKVRKYEDELSLYRLYRLSSPYDSVSPALVEELRYLSSRS
ncbi:MAG TPA: hypothetical protein VGU61_10385 [Noviherbaspirillum sp.]|jgi:hypothetical protein|uniref:hypothetical protein n=1 Tax=Noviherbaspirillum sp. TaxID=1926288 RepID=UPI002DDCC675|nr:hypothetical protein [Noviherbaspirillum sp.]HEV2610661.1 hypothetical protein [Noviherbaspirillum sp.]